MSIRFYLKKGIQRILCLYYFLQTRNKGVFNCCINSFCRFNKNEIFSKNINLNGCKIYGKGCVYFGENFHSGKGLQLLTSNHNYNGTSLPYDNTIINKDIIIENNVWIGIDVIILGGVRIGEGAIIQAGSVVSRDIPKLAIAGGNPAVPFKYRNKNHYNLLNSKRAFI